MLLSLLQLSSPACAQEKDPAESSAPEPIVVEVPPTSELDDIATMLDVTEAIVVQVAEDSDAPVPTDTDTYVDLVVSTAKREARQMARSLEEAAVARAEAENEALARRVAAAGPRP